MKKFTPSAYGLAGLVDPLKPKPRTGEEVRDMRMNNIPIRYKKGRPVFFA